MKTFVDSRGVRWVRAGWLEAHYGRTGTDPKLGFIFNTYRDTYARGAAVELYVWNHRLWLGVVSRGKR